MSRNHRGRILGEPVTRSLPAPAGGVQLETFIPWTLVKRGSKTQVITPLDAPQEFVVGVRQEKRARDTTQDTPLMRALGLAHYWQRLLDERHVASAAEIAKAEDIDLTQVRRMLQLTLLAPEVVEQLIVSPKAKLEPVIRRAWSTDWHSQGKAIASSHATLPQRIGGLISTGRTAPRWTYALLTASSHSQNSECQYG
uniref:Bacteriophage-related protein (Modular protein) n=1 Tax=Ralstonia solanacearum TaxID=305 RepID=A0A0S4WFQ6_RALSL|nr:Putative bacteriophage-related protein (modular protein) [Ralstonia solanacearum]